MPYIHRSSQRFWTSRRAILCGFAGLAGASAVPANGEAEFRFGLTPVFLDNNMTLLSLLHEYLAQQVGRSVAFVKRRTYQEISSLLLSGQLDAASICDFSYVQYQDRLALLAVPLYRNQPLHQAYVIVNEASEARTFDDIRGTVHAFSDPDSTSGYLITRWLLALRRENPAEFFRSFFFTYGYRNVIRAVATRLAESGSVEGYVWDVMKERRPELGQDADRVSLRAARLSSCRRIGDVARPYGHSGARGGNARYDVGSPWPRDPFDPGTRWLHDGEPRSLREHR